MDEIMAVAATVEAEGLGAVVRVPPTAGEPIVSSLIAAFQPIIQIPRTEFPIVIIPFPMVQGSMVRDLQSVPQIIATGEITLSETAPSGISMLPTEMGPRVRGSIIIPVTAVPKAVLPPALNAFRRIYGPWGLIKSLFPS